MYILPLCMLAVFVTVWNRTMAQPYALAVQVNGHTVGYVANEEVFNLAKEDVMQRINYAGSDKTELTIEPTYTISVTHKTMDESETQTPFCRAPVTRSVRHRPVSGWRADGSLLRW